MNPKSITIMLLLIIASAALLYVNQEQDYTAPTKDPKGIVSLKSLNPEIVEVIELGRGEQAFEIKRSGTAWILPSLWDSMADSEEVMSFLADLKTISEAEERGRSTASHETFNVAAQSAIRVSLKDPDLNPIIGFYLGKVDGTGRTFIRIAGEDKVYSVKPNLLRRAAFAGAELRAQSWFKKLLYQLPAKSEVRQLIVENGSERIVLDWIPGEIPEAESGESDDSDLVKVGSDPQWWISEPEKMRADDNTVKGMISSLKNVRCEEPLDPSSAESLGFGDPSGSITAVLANGGKVTLEFAADRELSLGGEGVAVRIQGDTRIVLSRLWVKTNLLKSLEELKAVPRAAPEQLTPTLLTPEQLTPTPEKTSEAPGSPENPVSNGDSTEEG